MFNALLKKQFMEMGAFLTNNGRTGQRRSPKAALGYLLFFSLMLLVMMGSFGAMAWPIAQVLVPAGQSWIYFATMELTALLMSVIVGAFAGYSGLFAARDNETLLAMPIPPWMILSVRLLTLLATNLGCVLLVWVPTVAVYVWYAPKPLGAVLSALPVALILAGISSILSAILGWVVAEVNGRVRHKSLVTVVLSLAFLGGYYLLVRQLELLLQRELRLLAEAEPSGPIWVAGRAAGGDAPALLTAGLIVLAAAGSFCGLLGRKYLRLMTTRRSTKKAVYREKRTRRSGLRQTLLRRELLHLGSSPAYLLNCSLGTGMLVIVGGVLLVKAEEIRSSAAELFPSEFLPLLLCAMVCVGLASNLLAAPSVSLEGETLWLIRSLPVTGWQALRAKLDLHLLLTAVPAVLCTLCGGVAFQIGAGSLLPVLLVVLLFSGFTALFDLMAGLCWPNLHWTSETAVIKQSLFSVVAMLGSWGAAVILAGLGFLLLRHLPGTGVLACCAVLLAGADLLLFRWVRGAGCRRFEEL